MFGERACRGNRTSPLLKDAECRIPYAKGELTDRAW
jgi:hypothetical protein